MILWLILHTSDTGFVELLYISMKAKPGISIANEFQCFVLTEVSGKDMTMIILENMCAITSRWYVDSVIKKEKTIGVCGLSAICRNIFCSNWVTRESQKNISV